MSNEITLKSKLGQLADISQIVVPGSFVAIGGGWSCNKPMAIVREIIRQEIGGLKVMSITGGWEMEYYQIDEYVSQGNTVIALGSTAWTNKTTGKRVETQKADVWKFRDGKAVSFLEFYDSCALMEAAS